MQFFWFYVFYFIHKFSHFLINKEIIYKSTYRSINGLGKNYKKSQNRIPLFQAILESSYISTTLQSSNAIFNTFNN